MKTKIFHLTMALVMAVAMMLSLVGVAAPTTPVAASPDELHVGEGNYTTIQDAIDAASPGDTIIVDPGTYPEQLFIDKQLTILSSDGAANTTINGTGLTDLWWRMAILGGMGPPEGEPTPPAPQRDGIWMQYPGGSSTVVELNFAFHDEECDLAYLELDIYGPQGSPYQGDARIQVTFAANETDPMDGWSPEDKAVAQDMGVSVSYEGGDGCWGRWTITVDTSEVWGSTNPWEQPIDSPVWPAGMYDFYIEVGDGIGNQWGDMMSPPDYAHYIWYLWDYLPVVWIDASQVVFGATGQGFTITGATIIDFGVGDGPPEQMGVGMLNLVSHCTIEDNLFDDNIAGYWSWYGYSPSNNQILDNEFSGNGLALQLIEGGGDTVSGNTFTENMGAITLEGGGSHQILNNTLNLNAQGIEFHGSHGNIISGNDISDTTGEDWVVDGDGIVVPIDGVAIELMGSNDNTIGNNTISKDTEVDAANYGIRLRWSSDNDILLNDISDCHNDGILLQGGSNENLVQDNTVNGCGSDGIALNQSNNNDVLGNEVYNCLTGIHVYTPMPGSGNQIGGTEAGEGNTVYDCEVGIVLDNSWNEAVVGNTVYQCLYGIYLINSHGITVEDNYTWKEVEGNSTGNSVGILLENSGGIPNVAPPNTIRGNDISHNDWAGLVFNEGSNNNLVAANKIHYNGHGIWIEGDNNFICGNDIRYNTPVVDSGVHLTADADGNQIHCNNIVGNTVREGGNIISWGMFKEGGSPVDAQDNWWGDPNGPGGVGPGGVGDAVNEYVNFAPWSTTEFTFPDVTGPVIADTAAVPDTISLLDTDFLSGIMSDYWYSIGPSYTDLIVDTGCEPCEATSVTVDLSALVLGMLPEDINEVVAGWDPGKQNEWQQWLNQLGNTQMEYREYWEEGQQYCYWDYELHLNELLQGGQWGGWNLAYFFGDDELTDMVSEEFRLGEFEIPVTAVDCSGNPTSDVIVLAIVDFQLPMKEEWNIRSSPIALSGTWGDIKDMGNGLSYEAIVMWDAQNWKWVEPSSNATMAPLQAYYIKLSENDQLGLIIEREATGPPERRLYEGWNLIGFTPDLAEHGFHGMLSGKALASIYLAAGGLPGWGIVISPAAPGMNIDYEEQFSYNDIPLERYEWWFYQNAWTAYPDGEQHWMSRGGGYWVYMDNDDVLAGYSYTPLPWRCWPLE